MPAQVQEAYELELERLACELRSRLGRCAWLVLVEDERGELRALSNVGESAMTTLMARWRRQVRSR